MYLRKLAAAAGFATGAALAFAPLASADTTSDAASTIDGLLSGVPAAGAPINIDISFDGYTLYDGGGTADAFTGAEGNGNFDLAIAYGDHATAYAAGGFGDNALASGTYALAEAGSKTAGATGFNFDSATDIGNNADPSTFLGQGTPDGAYAGGGSLLAGGTDSSAASSNDTAQFLGNGGINANHLPTESIGGNSGAFAGDGHMIGASGAGNGDTAYTSGNINGFGDGSAAVAGNSDSAYTTGTETGQNEGAFAGFGNYDSATADTNFTISGSGVDAAHGNYNYAFVDGPNNSTADAGGTAANLGNNNIAYVSDPFSSATSTADSADAGSNATGVGNSDLAEVLLTHGNASAQGANNLYDILSLFGNAHSASLPAAADAGAAATGAAAEPGAVPSFASTLAGEISSMNSLFTTEADLAGVGTAVIAPSATANPLYDTIPLADAPDSGTTPTTLGEFLYGVDSIAQAGSGPGAYDLFNGASGEFYNAYNTELFVLDGGTGLAPSADLLGTGDLTSALSATTVAGELASFWNAGVSDLAGYFDAGNSLSFLDLTPTAATDTTNFLTELATLF